MNFSEFLRTTASEKTALRNFAIFPKKHLCLSLFLIMIQASRHATLSKKRFQQSSFPVNIAKFLGADFLIGQPWGLLLPQSFLPLAARVCNIRTIPTR